MITTSGFPVQVMPTYTPVDPSLVAFNPAQGVAGAQDVFNAASTLQNFKLMRQHEEELAKTMSARHKQIEALSKIAQLNSEKAQRLFEPGIATETAQLAAGASTAKASQNKAEREIANAPQLDSIARYMAQRDEAMAKGMADPDFVNNQIELQRVEGLNRLNDEIQKWQTFPVRTQQDAAMRDFQLQKLGAEVKLINEHADAYKAQNALNTFKASGGVDPQTAARVYGSLVSTAERVEREANQADKNIVNEDQTVKLGDYRAKMFTPQGVPRIAPLNAVGTDPVEKALKLTPNKWSEKTWQPLPEGYSLTYTPGSNEAMVMDKNKQAVGKVALPYAYSPLLHSEAAKVMANLATLEGPRGLRANIKFYREHLPMGLVSETPGAELPDFLTGQTTGNAPAAPAAPSATNAPKPPSLEGVFIYNPQTKKYEQAK